MLLFLAYILHHHFYMGHTLCCSADIPEQNEGAGLQHLALKSDNIFHTLRELRKRSDAGGFDFMPPASDAYYRSALSVNLMLSYPSAIS